MSDWWAKNGGLITNIAGSAIDAGMNGPMPSVNKPTGNMDSPYFYQGQYQPQMDQQFYNNTQNYGAYNPYLSGYQGGFQGNFNNAQATQPNMSNAYQGIGNYYQATQNNPYTNQFQMYGDYMPTASRGVSNAASQFAGTTNWAGGPTGAYSQLGNQTQWAGQQMGGSALGGLHAVNQLMPETFNYQYANPMIQGAQQAGTSLGGVGQRALDASATLPQQAASAYGGLQSLASGYGNQLNNFATSGAGQLSGLAGQTTQGILPYAQTTAAQLPGIANSYTMPGNAAGRSILNTAFDPQSELYSREYMRNLDSTRSALGSRGLNRSLVGAGVEADSSRNFNLDWMDRQLGRQVTGLGAYGQNAATNYGIDSGARGQGLDSLVQGSQATFNPYLSAYGAGVSGLDSAARTGYGLASQAANDVMAGTTNANIASNALGQAGAGQVASGTALPWQTSQNVFNNQIGQLGQLGQLGSTYGQQLGGASQLGSSGIDQRLQGGVLPLSGAQSMYGAAQQGYGASQVPYSTYNQIQGDRYLGANNYLNAGNTYLQGLQGIGGVGLQGMSGAQTGAGINTAQAQQMLQYLAQGTNAANAYGNANNGWLYASMMPYQGMYASGQGGSSIGGDLAKLGMSFLL